MYQSINFYQFRDAFNAIRPNNFTPDGLQALFDHLEDYEEQTETQTELDVIAICCDFVEYETVDEALSNYQLSSLEELEQMTTVITIPNSDSIIIQAF